jgi:hypothetical protein
VTREVRRDESEDRPVRRRRGVSAAACEFKVSTANIESAVLARDEAGSDRTAVFAPGDTFYCVVKLANAPDGTTVKAVWTAIEAVGAPANTEIDSSELTTGSGELHFQLAKPGVWPAGRYKVELYLDGKLDRTLEFQVGGM